MIFIEYNLNASNSHLWMNCPNAAVPFKTNSNSQQEKEHNDNSKFSILGQKAHEFAKIKLICEFQKITFDDFQKASEKIFSGLSAKEKNKIISEVEQYSSYIKNIIFQNKKEGKGIPKKAIEMKLDCSKFFSPPGISSEKEYYGVVDFLMFYNKDLYVVDFKFGDGIEIEAVNNTQLMIYACAFLVNFPAEAKTINNIHLLIYQDFELKTFEISKDKLLFWMNNDFFSAIQNVYENYEKTCKGVWCNKFCKKRNFCKEHIKEINNIDKNLNELSDEELVETFNKIQNQKKTIENIENYIRNRIAGNGVNGLMLLCKTQMKINDDYAFLNDILDYCKKHNIDFRKVVNVKCRKELEKVINSEDLENLLKDNVSKFVCKGVIKNDTREK